MPKKKKKNTQICCLSDKNVEKKLDNPKKKTQKVVTKIIKNIKNLFLKNPGRLAFGTKGDKNFSQKKLFRKIKTMSCFSKCQK